MPRRTLNTKATTLDRIDEIGPLLARIVDSAAVGMIVSDMSGRVVYINRALTALLGHTAEDAAGKSVLDIIHKDDTATARLQLRRLMRNEAEEYRGEHRFCHKDGHPLWVMVAAALLRDETTGKPAFVITQLTNIELQKKAEAALAHSESRWNFALESARQGVWDHDIVNDTMFYSRMWRVMRGIPPEEEVDGNQSEWLKRIHPDDLQHVIDNVDRQDKGDEGLDGLEYRERRRDGSYVWILSRGKPVEWDEEGNPTRTLGTDTDITHLKLTEHALAAEKERLRVTLDAIADGMIATDEQARIVLMNPAAEQLTGWTSAEAMGQSVATVFVVGDGATRAAQPCPVAQCLSENAPVQLDGDVVLLGKGGTRRDVRCTAAPLKTAGEKATGAVLVFQDVTQSRAIQRELAHSAAHDALTGLPNRNAFDRALNSAIASARDSRGHCLLYVDLDRFKPVNDTSGHAAGDELLRQVAETIRGSCRSHDVAARIGGDEFAVLLHDCPLESGKRIADKIVHAIGALDFSWAGRNYRIGASVGLTTVGAQPASPLGFMGEADAACYAAKARGRGMAVAFGDL
ncbi:MAG TPA: PAS domain S-box protein [Devosia sp.]|jgi:diguanylate cyclase (GGDEF)-like protein/PAS domain S-box-containing protein|uniref:PAS domain S-box protein n=1 Tax=Devosia sp. TaxID=1871048 RepID=UPI002F91D7EC